MMNIPGTPRGRQFTDARPNSKSVPLMAFTLAAAHGWNGGGSSGVALGSNCLLPAASNVNPPVVPGNQTPDKSGCPSEVRGAGPPLGKGTALILLTGTGPLSLALPALSFCAAAGENITHNAARPIPTAKR